jgi:hypothetical protein
VLAFLIIIAALFMGQKAQLRVAKIIHGGYEYDVVGNEYTSAFQKG